MFYGLKCGIEIEAEGVTPNRLMNWLKGKGVTETLRGRCYITDPRRTWTIKSDGSLGIGCEVTSPIMCSEDYLKDLKFLVSQMHQAGLRGTSRAGIHIHVGIPNLDLFCDKSKFFIHNWAEVMPRIKRNYHPKGDRSRYCHFSTSREVLLNNRYSALNLSRRHYETVEFRFFNSQLNMRYIIRALRFACGFTRLSWDGVKIQLKAGDSIEKTLSRALKEETMT